jgi:CDP-diacylglycerol--glycerol-3-phosphate 3-phosphatidyltransferase
MAVSPSSPSSGSMDLLWTTPNLLSLFRILLVPILVYILREPGPLAGALAAVLFVLGSLSDYYDGYLARKHGIVTTLGKFLDPLADKLLVVSVLIMLVAMPCTPEVAGPCEARVPAWLVVLIVGRELAVTGLRSIASSEGITLGAEELGKYKTIFQIFALTGLLMHYRYFFVDFHLGGVYFLWIAFVLGMWSAVDYHRRVYREVRTRRRGGDARNVDSQA